MMKTEELIEYFSERGIPRSKVLSKKRQQNPQMQYIDGWYANEERTPVNLHRFVANTYID